MADSPGARLLEEFDAFLDAHAVRFGRQRESYRVGPKVGPSLGPRRASRAAQRSLERCSRLNCSLGHACCFF
jgi:hypothetical protein